MNKKQHLPRCRSIVAVDSVTDEDEENAFDITAFIVSNIQSTQNSQVYR